MHTTESSAGKRAALIAAVLLAAGLPCFAEQDDGSRLFAMPIEELSQQSYVVYGASRFGQTLSEAPSSVTIVTADEIRKYGYRSYGDIIRSVAGFFTTYDRQYTTVGVRGFGGIGDYDSRILRLVDGQRVNDSIFNSPYMDGALPDIDLIDHIEIIRGPGSSLYGSNAFFAVINVVTKNGRDYKGTELSGETASHETYKGRATYGNKFDNGLEVLLSGTNYDSKGQNLFFKEFDDPATNNGVAENCDTETYGNMFAKIAFGDFAFEGTTMSRDKRTPAAPNGTVFNDNRSDARDFAGFLNLKYEHDFDDLMVLSRVYYGTDNSKMNYAFPDPYAPGTDLVTYDVHGRFFGGELQFARQIFEKHKLIWGADYQKDTKQQQNLSDQYYVYLDDNRQAQRWGIYIQDEIKVLDNLIFNLGVRRDEYTKFGSSTNPRLGLIYNPFERTTVKLLYGRAFRIPSPYELYYQDVVFSKANPDLNPETIETYELILEQQLNKELRASVSGYIYKMHDVIKSQPYGPDPNFSVFENSGGITARGLEFRLNGKWGNGWQGKCSYSLVRSEYDSTGEELPFTPEQMVKGNLIVPLIEEKLFAGIETQYESGRKTLMGNRTDNFMITNLTLTYLDILKGLDISAGVYNLFDAKYGNPGFHELRQNIIEQDGISYRIKLTYRF
jgi:outer membrane receptor for ferrienterochelin and colicins